MTEEQTERLIIALEKIAEQLGRNPPINTEVHTYRGPSRYYPNQPYTIMDTCYRFD